ncbi:MAG: DUF5309 domain-containing protein [Veillonellaceae bacterium]|nr:DUF5309 domain-containing protein [Veillonellaceae bacterium]
MGALDQPKTTYTDTTPQLRAISDIINIIDPRDTPVIAALGGLDSARSKFKINQDHTKIELLEDELDSMTGACAESTTIATDDTSFSVADASVFQDGHVIKIDDEYMVVKSADTDANTITVYSRSYGGTNATHATNASIEIVGMARLEGDDADYGPIMDITAPYNYTSTFQKAFKISGTQQAIDQLGGISDEYEYQAAKTVPALLRLVEKSIFHGVRSAGSATAPRSMGGLLTFITDNSVNAGGAITKTDVDDAVEATYLDGGNPDMIFCNPSVGRDLKDAIDNSSYVKLAYENSQIGMQPLQRFVTQYGALQIVMSRFCPVSKAFVVDSRKVGLYSLRPFGWHDIAVSGDSKKGEVIGEFSMLVANDKAHAWIYGVTS